MLKSVERLLGFVGDRLLEFVGDMNAIDGEWLDGWNRAVLATIEKIEQEVAERYVELPKDADGVPWHLGDVTENGNTVRGLRFDQHGWHFFGTVNDIDPSIHRHHHEPTVEDVLWDMLDSLDLDPTSHVDTSAVIAEYAQRLQLREVDE